MAITLTEKAAQRVQKFLAQRSQGIGLRVTVIVDQKSLVYLDGTELDFAREGLNEGFKFNNPNVKAQCGCGESFSI